MLPVETVVWASPLAVNVNSRIQISMNRVTLSKPRGDTISFTKPFPYSLVLFSSFRFLETRHRKLETISEISTERNGGLAVHHSTEVPSCQPGDNKVLLISLPDANAIMPLQQTKATRYPK